LKAIILAAGLGTRLRPLTERRPKPLVPVMNVPLLGRLLEVLRRGGIREVCCNLHHLPGQIERFLVEKEKEGFTFHTAFEPEILDTGGGLAHFADVMAGEDCFLLHNGDVACLFSIAELASRHRESGAHATLLLVDHPPTNGVFAEESGEVVGLRDFRAAGFEDGLALPRPLTYSGLALFSPEIFSRLPRGRRCSLITVLIAMMREKPGSVRSWAPGGVWWSDLGSPASYLDVHRACFGPSPPPLPGLEAPETPVVLGVNSVLEEGARVEGFLVAGANCFVGEGVRLRDCVLWDGTVVRAPFEAERAVLDGDVIACA